MFDRIDWKDHVVERPRTYTEVTNGDGSKTYTPAPGEVYQQGTPQSATNFNLMEDGICDARLAEDIFYQYAKHSVIDELADHEDEFAAETGTVTLTNSNKVFFGFNNSGSTVALTKTRKTLNYDLEIVVDSYTGGQMGDVIVYDKQLNGFKLKFEGSASSAVIKYKVRGGMIA